MGGGVGAKHWGRKWEVLENYKGNVLTWIEHKWQLWDTQSFLDNEGSSLPTRNQEECDLEKILLVRSGLDRCILLDMIHSVW